MDIAVLVPRRPEPWRDQLWAHVRGSLGDNRVVEGLDDGPEPMNRSAAINRAAEAAGDWDVAVILDADILIDLEQLKRGIAPAAAGALVLPHDHFRSLTRKGTQAVLSGSVQPREAQTRWITPRTKSSCLCVSRELWEMVGGFDERFVGWGFEDAAFFAACRTLAGVERQPGPVTHCWHPRSAEKNESRHEYRANRALAERYKAARGAAEMRALLAE